MVKVETMVKTLSMLLFGWCFAANAIAASPTPQWRTAQQPPPAQGQGSIESRLARIERLLDNRALLDLTMRLETLQNELSQLRGQIEQLGYTTKQISDQQRQTYVDLDGRLQGLEGKLTQYSGTPRPVAGPGGKHPVSNVAFDPEHARQEYQKARNLIKARRYDDALTALVGFVKSYPQSEFAGNAQYWLGELNFAKRQFKIAAAEFDKVVKQFPQSNKVPDAMLKRGFSYYELGDWANARQSLANVAQIVQANSTIARMANERLKRMKKEGH